jgi:uncharacterized membrane protein YeaQ/YmgE (transglycosylase-associated protein family)
MPLNDILTWILLGAVIGILADFLVRGIRLGLIGKIIVGILGALLGGWLFSVLGISIATGFLSKVISGTVGAVILLFILRLIRHN